MSASQPHLTSSSTSLVRLLGLATLFLLITHATSSPLNINLPRDTPGTAVSVASTMAPSPAVAAPAAAAPAVAYAPVAPIATAPHYSTSTHYTTSTYAPASTLPAVILPPSPQSAADLLANYSAEASLASSTLDLYAPSISTSVPDAALTPIIYPTGGPDEAAPSNLIVETGGPPTMTTTSSFTASTAAPFTANTLGSQPTGAVNGSLATGTGTASAAGSSKTGPSGTSGAVRINSVWGGKAWLVGLGFMGLLLL